MVRNNLGLGRNGLQPSSPKGTGQDEACSKSEKALDVQTGCPAALTPDCLCSSCPGDSVQAQSPAVASNPGGILFPGGPVAED